MGLFHRITGIGAEKISVHRFGAMTRQWAAGGVTRARMIAAFNFVGDEITQLDALAATYQALPQSNLAQVLLKAQYLDSIEDVCELCESGDFTEEEARARLGF